jgi:hypothetical protein
MNIKEIYIKFSQDQVQFTVKEKPTDDQPVQEQQRKNDSSLEIRIVRTFHKVLNIPRASEELDSDNFQTLGETLMKVLSDFSGNNLPLQFILKSYFKDPNCRCRIYLDFEKKSGGYAELPWEYLFLDGEFLAAHRQYRFDLIRKIPRNPVALPPIARTGNALNLIYLACDPQDARYEKIDGQKIEQVILKDLREAFGANKIRAFAMDPATNAANFKKNFAEALMQLRQQTPDEPYIFHFFGHAVVKKDGPNGCLVFPPISADNPAPDEVNETRFENFFADQNDLPQVVVLQACGSGRIVNYDLDTGVALRLAAKRNIPAVVSLQNEVSLQASLKFVFFLYGRILVGDDIAEAMTRARKFIGDDYLLESGREAFSQNLFGSPVLMLTTEQPFVLVSNTPLSQLPGSPQPALVKVCVQKRDPRCSQFFAMDMAFCPICKGPLAVQEISQTPSTALSETSTAIQTNIRPGF